MRPTLFISVYWMWPSCCLGTPKRWLACHCATVGIARTGANKVPIFKRKGRILLKVKFVKRGDLRGTNCDVVEVASVEGDTENRCEYRS